MVAIDLTPLSVDDTPPVVQRSELHLDSQTLDCPVPLTVRGTQALVSFAPLAFKLFYAARQNAVLRRSPFPPP